MTNDLAPAADGSGESLARSLRRASALVVDWRNGVAAITLAIRSLPFVAGWLVLQSDYPVLFLDRPASELLIAAMLLVSPLASMTSGLVVNALAGNAAVERLRGGASPLRRGVAAALRKVGPLIATILTQLLMLVAALVGPACVVATIGWLVSVDLESIARAEIALLATWSATGVACYLLFLWIWVRALLAPLVAVREPCRGLRALRLSFGRTRDVRWRWFGLFLATAVASTAAWMAATGAFAGLLDDRTGGNSTIGLALWLLLDGFIYSMQAALAAVRYCATAGSGEAAESIPARSSPEGAPG